jgi:hypothetical protein
MTRRRWTALAALGLVLALGAGGTAYATAYRPLAYGAMSGVEGAELVEDEWADEPRYVLPYRDRQVTRALLSLRNDGRWAVRVERVGTPLGTPRFWRGLLDVRPDRNGLNPPNEYAYADSPFEPFTLEPGEERTVAVALWTDNCEHSVPGSEMTVSGVPVRFRAFGMARTQYVPLETPWSVVAPRRCPRPPAA